ncbi:UNVERIFIED_CONTAM: putative sugar phosphate/phosphate translocator [Sesamum radiatum]|uniref:Sugar phosphate/phosphate translocator n=1 Tax=Sesamum radiatum TaxID=300843 RepID=A0AAW2NC27_SESRA
MCHMTACSLLSYIAIAWMKMVPMQTIRSRVQFMKISALSFIFCTSVVSGNISLKYLPVSFNQAIGATTPFFTAVFAYLMTLKREAWLTYVTLIPVVTGVIIASGGEPSFHLFGFIMCIGATAARALKSVLQAVVLLLPATLFMEENVVGITLALAREDNRIIWLLLFNSALAYFVNLTNFLVTKHTSALTLQGEPSFHLFGFIMCVGATAARALKSVVQGILLSSEGEKLNSMNLLLYMAPIAVVLLLPATLFMEENVVGITKAVINLTDFWMEQTFTGFLESCFSYTRGNVLGNAKGAVAVVVSILIFRNPVSVTGMLGYSLTVFGVILYSEAKKRTK